MSAYGCKVCRVLDEHEMKRYEQELLDQWQADGAGRKGYRQLAEWLNVAMLRRQMDRAGLSTLGDEAESKYERLTSTDDAVASEVRTDLHDAGIDIESLEKDFVSYGVIRTHLKECLGAEREVQPSDWEESALQITRNHARSKVAEAISALGNKGELAITDDHELHVNFELECHDCHTRVSVEKAIRQDHVCNCTDRGTTVEPN